jgi:hypothetical protein
MGRYREIRGGRFEPNMGVAEVAVKSTGVERGPFGSDLISKRLQNTVLELHPEKGYSAWGHRTEIRFDQAKEQPEARVSG